MFTTAPRSPIFCFRRNADSTRSITGLVILLPLFSASFFIPNLVISKSCAKNSLICDGVTKKKLDKNEHHASFKFDFSNELNLEPERIDSFGLKIH